MTMTLNEEETRAYINALHTAEEFGIPFGAFVTKALEYKRKIKSRDAHIAELKQSISSLKAAAKETGVDAEKPSIPAKAIPDLYAEQRALQKEEESAHTDGMAVIMGAAPTKVTVHTTEDSPKASKKAKDKKRCSLNKADKAAFHVLAINKIKASCSVEVFAAQRNLSPKTVLTYIEKHSDGKYMTCLGSKVKKSAIWPGASVHPNETYFTAV